MPSNRIILENVGQLRHADVTFGDLTVLVGPQATGKSIFLQWLKLLLDSPSILMEFKRFNIDLGKDWGNLLELYFGEGMTGIWKGEESKVWAFGKEVRTESLMRRGAREESLFFIPAQRVMSLRDGTTRTFAEYRAGDPFVLREFSDQLHRMMQSEFGTKQGNLFPQSNRLNESLRKPIAEHVFGGFNLRTQTDAFQRRFTLATPGTTKNGNRPLPYLVWSAGQREFVPLLLGFYWLMPPSKSSRRDPLKWVVIEEPEMGLHPDAISVVILMVLELLRRGYRVCLSTHSPHVLDVVWALRVLRENDGTEQDVRALFRLASSEPNKKLARSALTKVSKVYFFNRGGSVKDISTLDPGSEDDEVSGWGGLTGFSGEVGEVVARVVSRSQLGTVA